MNNTIQWPLYGVLRWVPGAFLFVLFVLSALTVALQSQAQEAATEGGPISAPAVEPLSGIALVTVVEGLDEPWGMDFLPDRRLLVTEKSGALKRIDPASGAIDLIEGVPESVAPGQGGLLDVLVHPDFADNGWVYLSYVVAGEEADQTTTRVSRGRLVDDTLQDVEVLFTAEPAFNTRRHYGSRLLLDDGYLYITVGDRGNRHLAQSLETHNGKVIRLTEEGAIPLDNPFAGKSGAQAEIWSYGHRNPQGMAKHPLSGAIWVAEHGPQGGDEINVLKRGANYGWPLATYGEEYGGGKIGEGTHKQGTEQPLVYWVPSIGASGIAFYNADTYSDWAPSLLVGALKLTRLDRLQLEGEGVGEETQLMGALKLRIRDVQVGPDGRVYLLADGSRLLRLDPVTAEPRE